MEEEYDMYDNMAEWWEELIQLQPLMFCSILCNVHFITLVDLIFEKTCRVYIKCEISVYESWT